MPLKHMEKRLVAEQAYIDYIATSSDINLLAWFKAELDCDNAALRQHGHHDADVLYMVALG